MYPLQFFIYSGLVALLFGCHTKTMNNQEIPVRFDNLWSSPFGVDSIYPYHLSNADGKYLFLLNKTAWAYFACDNPVDVLKNAEKHGANVIRVALEGTPYFDQLGYDMWPWGGTRENPDWTTFNEVYWQNVEERMQLAGKHGIGIDLVLYFSLTPEVNQVDIQKKYWDQAIKRLSQYSNLLTWEIMNEEISNEAFQDSAGTYLKLNDPFRHLVCSSDGTTENALWPDKKWMDLAIVHTCTGNQPQYDLENWYLNIARNTRQFGKPAFNNESGREKRHKNDDPVHRRKQGWLFSTAGCFWTWHSWDGCEGINDTTYTGPGWEYVKPMKNYFESLPFWQLSPSYTSCTTRNPALVTSSTSAPDRSISLMYTCTRNTGQPVNQPEAFIRLVDGTYQVRFINPADLQVLTETELISKGLRNEYQIQLPTFQDDLLVEIRKTNTGKKSLIEGTL